MAYTYNRILFIFMKEGNPSTCDNMNEPGGLYANWNTPVKEGQILHDSTSMNCLVSFTEAKNRMVVVRGWLGLNH